MPIAVTAAVEQSRQPMGWAASMTTFGHLRGG